MTVADDRPSLGLRTSGPLRRGLPCARFGQSPPRTISERTAERLLLPRVAGAGVIRAPRRCLVRTRLWSVTEDVAARPAPSHARARAGAAPRPRRRRRCPRRARRYARTRVAASPPFWAMRQQYPASRRPTRDPAGRRLACHRPDGAAGRPGRPAPASTSQASRSASGQAVHPCTSQQSIHMSSPLVTGAGAFGRRRRRQSRPSASAPRPERSTNVTSEKCIRLTTHRPSDNAQWLSRITLTSTIGVISIVRFGNGMKVIGAGVRDDASG